MQCSGGRLSWHIPLATEKTEGEKASADPHREASTGERASKWGESLIPKLSPSLNWFSLSICKLCYREQR